MAKLTPGLQKIVKNISWLLAERILIIILSLLINIYVIRYLGAEDFGKLSYSTSFVGLFLGVSKLGLDDIVVKQLVEKNDQTKAILGSSFVLKVLGSITAIVLISFTIFKVNLDSSIQTMTILIGIGLIFSAFDVIELSFQSKVASQDIARIKMIQFVISCLLRYLAVVFRLPLIIFAGLIVFDSFIKSLGFVGVYLKKFDSNWPWKMTSSWLWYLLRQSYPLIISAVMVTIYFKIDQIMLGNLLGNKAVGYYAVAVRLSELWYFIPVAVCASLFPSILVAKNRSSRSYIFKLQLLYDLVAWLAILIAIAMTFLSQPLIILLVGESYRVSGQILMIHIWASLFVFLGLAGHQWLIAENFTAFSSLTTFLGAASNVILNFFLIPKYEGIGAAIATIIAYGISSHLTFLIYPLTRQNGLRLTKALLIPFRFQQNLIYFKLLKTRLSL